MTDARFPDRWLTDRRLQRLDDGHFRAFITSLTWSVSNRTDGVIEPEDLALIPNFAAGAVKALIAAGLWSSLGKGWRITEFAVTQTTKEQLNAIEQQRANEREKKARQRAAKLEAATSTNADVPVTVPALVPKSVPGDVPRDNLGKDRPGKDRPGLGAATEEQLPLAAGSEDWPVWRGPGPDPYEYDK